MSTRTFVSYSKGSIRGLVQRGLITAQVHIQLRDKSHCGGPAGTGQQLRPAVLNVERVAGTLRLVIPAIVLPGQGPPVDLGSVGFVECEQIGVTGFSFPLRSLNGTYTISTAISGQGLGGPDSGSILLEMPSEGPDIAPQNVPGINLCLVNGRITVAFASDGDVLGQGSDFFGYIAGQLLPGFTGGGGPGGPNAERVVLEVPQMAHGFSPGEAIYFDGALWQRAQANNPATLATHLVYQVIDANTFLAIQSGYIDGLVGLVPGDYYFVSSTTPGSLVATDPSVSNSTFFSNPMLLAVSPSTGWVLPWRAYGPGNVAGGSLVSLATTVDVTPVNAQVISVPPEGVMLIETQILAREQAPNTDRATYIRTARVNVDGGVPTILSVQANFTSEDDLAWDVDVLVSGLSVVVQVIGDPANAVDWKIVTQVQVL